ncbi:MAG: tetratricopeptide repeat protein [Planctomycetes bacterium]|nr:tetratricopeptide repeat protein [Planctomycetota bacterium]
MRRLNLKFLLLLVASLCVVVLSVHLLHAFNLRSSTKVVLGKAEDARKQGDLRGAVRYYGEYLRQIPSDHEAKAAQALVAAEVTKQGDVRAADVVLADNLLEQALRQDELRERRDLRRKLIDIQILRGRPEEARKNIDKLTDPTKPDPELDFLYARCAYATGFFDPAIARLEPMTGYDGKTKKFVAKRATAADNIEAYMLLAIIRRENKKLFAEADACVDAMVAANPKSAKALMQRSAFQARYAQDGTQEDHRKRLAAAKEDLRRALAIEPKNVDALMQNADLDMKDKNFDAAVKHIQQAIALSPKNERLYLGLASVLFSQQKPKEAIAKVEEGLKVVPNSPDLVWGLHEIQWRQGNVDGVRESIKRMEEMKFMPERIQLAKARVPLVEQKWAEAAKLLEEVRPQLQLYANLAQSADMALGQCYGNLRQPDLQLKVYTRILQSDPNNVEAMRGRAAALTALLRYREALDVYQKGLASALGQEAFMSDRGIVGGYLAVLSALAQREEENREHFQTIIDRIRRKLKPEAANPVEALVFTADGLLRDKKYDEAIALLTKGISEQPKDMRLRTSLIATIAAQKGADAALDNLKEVERELGESPQTKLLRGELLVRKGGPDVKLRLAELESGIEKLTPPEQAEFWARMGSHYYRLGPAGRDEALRCYRQALALRPENGQLLEGLFELARESNDHLAMLKARDDIEKGAGKDSSLWKYAEAARAELKNEPESAIREYQKALELGPPNVAIVQRLVELQMSRGQYNEALQSLKRLGDAVALGKLGIVAEVLGNGNPEKALKDLEREVPEQSTNPSELLWKGQLLLRLKQMDKAEAAFRRAAQMGPNLPQTWLALVEFLARFKDGPSAEKVIRDAENQLSDDQAALVLAQCYTLLGSYQQAEHYYLMALRNSPKTPALARTIGAFYLSSKQPAKAVPFLNSLIESAPKLRQEDQQYVVWARREKAVLLAQNQSQPQFESAIRLIDANAASGAAAQQDALLKARLYASRRDPRSLRQAEKLYDQNKGSLGYDDKLALAHVYANTDQWEKARRLLVELNAEQPADARVITTLAETLLKRGETESAQPWIRKLEQIQAKTPQTVRLNAWLAMRRLRPDEAAEIVLASLPKQTTPQNIGQVIQGVRILEDIKNHKAAESLLRSVLPVTPGVKGELTEFLARRGRAEECFALLKEQLSDKTLEAACILGTNALREHKASTGVVPPAQSEQLLAWFEQSRQQPTSSISVKLNEAMLYDLLGQTQKSEQIYRQIIAMQDLPDFARATTANNLAFLLAVNGGDLGEAQKLIDFSSAQLGTPPELLDTQAIVALAKGNSAEAIKLLSEATQFGGSSEMFFHLALAYQKANDRGGAGRFLRRAREEGLRKEGLSKGESAQLKSLDAWLNS